MQDGLNPPAALDREIKNKKIENFDAGVKRMMTGRQYVWFVINHFKTAGPMSDLHVFQSLERIKWKGDNNLEQFIDMWDLALSHASDEVTLSEDTLRDLLYQKMKDGKTELLKSDVSDFEKAMYRFKGGTEKAPVEYSHKWLHDAIMREINIKRENDKLDHKKAAAMGGKSALGVQRTRKTRKEKKALAAKKTKEAEEKAKKDEDERKKALASAYNDGVKKGKGKGKNKGGKGQPRSQSEPPGNRSGKGNEEKKKKCWYHNNEKYSGGTPCRTENCPYDHTYYSKQEWERTYKAQRPPGAGKGGKGKGKGIE